MHGNGQHESAAKCDPLVVHWLESEVELLILASCHLVAAEDPESPANKVIDFIKNLKAEIQADTDAEVASFDKFKDWCNATVTAASSNIEEEKSLIEDCNRKIESWSGTEAASDAEIKNAKKNLADNAKSQAESKASYDESHKEFLNVTGEINASIDAMVAALAEMEHKDEENASESSETPAVLLQKKALAQRAVRSLLFQPMIQDKLSAGNLEVLRSYAAVRPSKPQQFLQVDRGVNEGYQESGGEAIGVIETTLSDFQADRDKANEEHAELTKSYNDKMKALADEKAELGKYLDDQASVNGKSQKDLADTKALRDENAAELKADEKLLESTQDTCKEKTYQFEQRAKLRAQEMAGIDKAIEILTGDGASETFKNAAKVSFAQVHVKGAKRAEAYKTLQEVASKYHDLKLAQLAVSVQSDSHFDAVIRSIDRQIAMLQDEDKKDVEHRDRCNKQLADTAAGLSSVGDLLTKTNTKIQRMESQAQEQDEALQKLQAEINETKAEMANRSAERKEESEEYLVALKHDEEALKLMTDAKAQIQKFFSENKIDMSFVQSEPDKVPDAVDKEEYKSAPDAGFEDQKYEGGKDSTNTLLKMMSMVEKDMTEEIENSKAEEKKNLALFEKDYSALKDLLTAQTKKELSSTKALADLQDDIESKKEFKDDAEAEKASSQEASDKLDSDCAWVKENFHSRREQRKAEIDGLVQAKGLLAGVAP